MEEQANPECTECPECGGRGEILQRLLGGYNEVWEEQHMCRDCQGTGLHPIPLSEFTHFGLKRFPQS